MEEWTNPQSRKKPSTAGCKHPAFPHSSSVRHTCPERRACPGAPGLAEVLVSSDSTGRGGRSSGSATLTLGMQNTRTQGLDRGQSKHQPFGGGGPWTLPLGSQLHPRAASPCWGCDAQHPANRAYCRAPSSTRQSGSSLDKGLRSAPVHPPAPRDGDRSHGPWWRLNRPFPVKAGELWRVGKRSPCHLPRVSPTPPGRPRPARYLGSPRRPQRWLKSR